MAKWIEWALRQADDLDPVKGSQLDLNTKVQ